jgi:orotate phosphoribosyltransferase
MTHHGAADTSQELARYALESGAFRLTPREPVRWASGYLMPVYTDNRLILRARRGRELVCTGLLAKLARLEQLENLNEISGESSAWDAVAGTASAGIAPAVLLAEALGTDFLYVRSETKSHGLQRQIEGLTPDEARSERPLAGKRVLLVEDLLSTGGSSAAAARALIEAGAVVPLCLAIFSYGFDQVGSTFAKLPQQISAQGEENDRCRPHAIFTLETLLRAAVALGYLDQEERRTVEEWRAAPFAWGAESTGSASDGRNENNGGAS